MGHECRILLNDSAPQRAAHENGRTWALVLSGGDGTRMRPFIQNWLGEDRPKQYCAFVGKRSMLEHTRDRATQSAAHDQVITIVGRGHDTFLAAAGAHGHLIEQPENLGTAPGIFVPAARVIEEDPDATLLIYPSDHFVYPEQAFVQHVNAAVEYTRHIPDQIVLLGARPDTPETDYGYIDPVDMSMQDDQDFLRVRAFHEKPAQDHAASLVTCGALWNTMVCAVRVQTLWEMGWECVPTMMEPLERYRHALRTVREGHGDQDYETRAFDRLYRRLQTVDFCKHVLQRVPERIAVRPMHDLQWSDWGRPERVAETLKQIGARPAFDTRTTAIWPLREPQAREAFVK